MDGEYKSSVGTKLVMLSVKAADFFSCNPSHFIGHSTTIKPKRILFTKDALVQFVIISVSTLTNLLFVVDGSFLDDFFFLGRVGSYAEVIELCVCFRIRKIWMIKGIQQSMKLLKKTVHSCTRRETIKVKVRISCRRALTEPHISQKS